MKFKYTGKGLNNYYGFNAKDGDTVETDEPTLIAKMKSHPDFKEADKKKAAPKKKDQ